MERYWMAKRALLNIPVIDGALPSETFTTVVLYADAQQALDTAQARVTELEGDKAKWEEIAGLRFAGDHKFAKEMEWLKIENGTLRDQFDAAQARVRTATQWLIDTIGSSGGPEDLEEALGRMVAELSTLRALVADLRAAVADRERQLWEMSQALHEERERRACAT